MDKSSIIGLAIAGFMIFMVLEEGGIFLYWNESAFLLVVFGSMGATICCFPWRNVLKGLDIIKTVFITKELPVQDTIKMLVRFAERARREGILALEKQVETIEDPFLKNGIRLAIDGTEPELLRSILETEISYMESRHEIGKQMFEKMGVFGPAFGLVGTLGGLIAMLANLQDTSKMAAGLAVSLVATFYGTIVANWIADPMSTKLHKKSEEEVLLKELMIMGIYSIQIGDNPRILEQKLYSFIDPGLRKTKE